MNPSVLRRRIVAGNWKMHGSRAETRGLLEACSRQPPSMTG
jgi:triosephosphate isomerase